MFNTPKDPLQPINPLQPKGGIPAPNHDTYNMEQNNVLKAVIFIALAIILSSISLPFIYTHSPAVNYNKACKAKGGTVITTQPKNETLCVTYTPLTITDEDLNNAQNNAQNSK